MDMEKRVMRLDKPTLGACYYPEHWNRALWTEDLARMLDDGIEVIRIAEFAWNLFEPQEGRFDFSFFDGFLELVETTPMKVIFCTPTATPPAWLTEKYPEVLNAEIDGTLYRHGMRRHYNYNAETYREKTRIIVTQLARHYGRRPSIIGWQIDNEINNGINEYYSQADHAAFREFLREKYHTLDKLNTAWGTVFWNQTYTAWEEIYLGRNTPRPVPNPHLALDAKRFYSWSAIRYCRLQSDILRREIAPEMFITTNGFFGHLDYDELMEQSLDCLTYDSYPAYGFHPQRLDPKEHPLLDRKWSMNLAEVRACAPVFGIMEQQSGPGGGASFAGPPSPKPGQMRLWTYQSIAHGADFVCYFRWRTCTFGSEIYWHGLLNYDNRDNRRIEELRQIHRELKALAPYAGARYRARVGILRDYDNEWDGELDAWHGPLRKKSTAGLFTAMQRLHIPFNFVNIERCCTVDDLLKYEVLFYPHATIATPAAAQLLTEYVQAGGVLVAGARTGYKDKNGHCLMQAMPGPLAALFGVEVNDFTQLPQGAEVDADFGGQPLQTALFHDIITPVAAGCETLATYTDDYYKGAAALTVNALGKGKAYYFGSVFTASAARALLCSLGLDEPYDDQVALPEGCELAIREGAAGAVMYILNYLPQAQTITVKQPMVNLPDGKTLEGNISMPPYEVYALAAH